MFESWQKNGQIVIGAGLLLLTALVVIGLYAFLYYPMDYVMRVLEYQQADVADYQIFPQRVLPASDQPVQYAENLQSEDVAARFEARGGLEDFEAFLAETGTQAFIVIENDELVYENYFNGAEPSQIVTSFSVAKSFGSALIGIAIEEGAIGSVTDPITDYLPELAGRDPDFAQITIEDLLRMSSGIRYEEFPFVNGDDALTYYYPDLRQLALEETRIERAAGERFLYNNYHPLLLGLILERATGMPVADYLAQKLWQPMGAEFDGSWSLDSETSGFEKMESGINGRAIDFAKLGSLYLHDGLWNGEQLVSAEWVAASTAPYRPDERYYPDGSMLTDNGYYGYMWWGLEQDGENDFAALGNLGQFIYVSPSAETVIVRHGERYGVDPAEWLALFQAYTTGEESEEVIE